MSETPPSAAELQIRTAGEDDRPGLVKLSEAAFGYTELENAVTPWVEAYSRPFSQVAELGDQIVGAAAAFDMRLTLPGGVRVGCPGVTSVAVLPTHRRQGVLKKMMWRQMAEMRRSGVSIAALTATEATIYEQFGYGAATDLATIEIDSRRAEFRTMPGPGSLKLIDSDEGRVILPGLHRTKTSVRHGMTSRPEEMWNAFFEDHESRREGRSALFHVIHLDDAAEPDGYVSYRVEEVERLTGHESVVHVEQLVGLRPMIEVDLWRFVCSIDLATSVRAIVAANDPVRHAFHDQRCVSTTGRRDHLWLRIIDLASLLGARRYERDGEFVLGSVDWEFTNNTGQFRVTIAGGAATVVRTDDKPQAIADNRRSRRSLLCGMPWPALAAAARRFFSRRSPLCRVRRG
ncbi:MAG: GNAT family N-acetyltransferase [Actinomycetota bacterium]|nr:GNAT family N-acetyltransferase [Actinomycetota bacterium]